MAISVPHRRYTVDDLDTMPEDGIRREIIDGRLYVTMPQRLWHQLALGALYIRLKAHADVIGIRVVLAPAGVRASRDTQVEPDLFAFPRANDVDASTAWVAIDRLLLAVEILSPSTSLVDQGRKRELYATHAIAEYWIVDVDACAVTVHSTNAPDGRVVKDVLTWQPMPNHDPLIIDLPAFFAEVRS